MFMDMLNQTIKCDACGGIGKMTVGRTDNEGTPEKEEVCKKCNGSGIVLDNKIGEIIKKYAPAIERRDFPKMMSEIYAHYEDKLQDSYDRGVRDGQEISKIKKQDEAVSTSD